MLLHRNGLQYTGSIQVFIKTVQFIIINGMRFLYKNEHLVHYYTEKNVYKITRSSLKLVQDLFLKDILVITFIMVQSECGGGQKIFIFKRHAMIQEI
jgi:hypothetical protein